MATHGIRSGDYVPNTTVRLPGATIPARQVSTGTSHQHSTITTLSAKTHSAVGGALGGASQIAGNDIQSVLQSLVQLLQQLVQLVSNMAGGAKGGGPGQMSGCDMPTGVKGMSGQGSDASPPAPPAAVGASAAPVAPAAVAKARQNNGFEQRVVDLVNQERAKYGLTPLTYNSALDRAAAGHNAQQVAARTMAHIDIGDGDPGSRIRQQGFNRAWGENVAVGQKTPEQVVGEWMASPTHRANILNGNYHQLGVSYATTADGYPFWTQEFGA